MKMLLLSRLFDPSALTPGIARISCLEFGDRITFVCEAFTSVRFNIVFALLMNLGLTMPAF